MSMDIGVVKIQYLDRPADAAYGFALHLSYFCDEADWTVHSEGNAINEYEHSRMLSVADAYATSQDLSPQDKVVVRDWIDGLPWENGMIMLHLG